MKTVLFLVAAASAYAAPCTTATPECTEWVALNGGPSRSLIYRTHSLDTRNEKITRALIVIHGQGRNADGYFRHSLAAAFLADALENTVIISPRFASSDGRSCSDTLAANEVNWRCAGDSWRSGAVAVNNDKLTSYDFTDEILRRLASGKAFPNLKIIVLTGHSAGGQYVSRYVMANQVHEKLRVPVKYVISNPSSYAYLDAERPAAEGKGFGPFREGRNCTTYDKWPYGLQERNGYAARLSDDQLKKQIASRPVVFLLSELDTLPLAGFDSSCPAMAQGPNRLARGQAYAERLNTKYGARHETVLAPMCGHNARCVYTTDQALSVLFPK